MHPQSTNRTLGGPNRSPSNAVVAWNIVGWPIVGLLALGGVYTLSMKVLN